MQRIKNYNSPGEISRFLAAHGAAASRRFGQNFLISREARERIIELLEPTDHARVWEIGPGLGAMTHHLVERDLSLKLFELDRFFAGYLRELYGDLNTVEIVEGDVLKTLPEIFAREGAPQRILGNLPYNIAAVIISSLIEGPFMAERMVFTVQKEVGERMTASPGTKEYSSFTVLCRFACDVADGGDIAPGAFYPRPHVTSSVVVLSPHGRYDHSLLPWVSRISRAMFSSRRKTLRNTLLSTDWAGRMGKDELLHLLKTHSIDPGLRGETLSPEKIVKLAKSVSGFFNMV